MKQRSKKISKSKKAKGSALLLTTILLFVILSMVISLSYVTVMEQKMSGKTKSSVGAFYSAESGVEWALNQIANKNGSDDISTISGWNAANHYASCPSALGGADVCKVYFLDDIGNVITVGTTDVSDIKAVRSVGTQGDETQRAIEAAVAAGGYSYTYYCYNNSGDGSPVCPATVTVGTQGPCDAGFKIVKELGSWGNCCKCTNYQDYFRPPGGSCGSTGCFGGGACSSSTFGKAYVCAQ